MKTLKYLAIILTLVSITSCVQKTVERKVRFLLDVSEVENVTSVGVKGSNDPLNWQKELAMIPIFADSIYAVDVTFVTGYLGAEVKFVVNGQLELQNQENRRFVFDVKKDTTIYSAIFDTLIQ
jgi:PBP1b-binding outer membrane lipoprotein LpoB